VLLPLRWSLGVRALIFGVALWTFLGLPGAHAIVHAPRGLVGRAAAEEAPADVGVGSDAGAAPSLPSPESAAEDVETIVVHETAPAETASSVHLGRQKLDQQPSLTPDDLLRHVPGLVVAQHAGGGKADQLFLRGFDADHGTDVAISVDGVPANMPSHGHGQGYADTHWVIPDLVKSVDVHKGPYSVELGDFYTAGAVEMHTFDEAPLTLRATLGTELDGPAAGKEATVRVVAFGSPELPAGKALLGGEVFSTDGPFANPQDFQRQNLFAKWRAPLGGGDFELRGTFYTASWNASGQIPERAVDAGTLDRFGSVDPSEGGDSGRESVTATWETSDDHGDRLRIQTFLVDYRLRLLSNFTFFARDPANGDEIEQDDGRTISGISARLSRPHRLFGGLGVLTLGVQGRHDDVDEGLWHAAKRVRLSDCFDDGTNPCFLTHSRISDAGIYAEEELQLDWLRITAGLRYDFFVWDVDDLNPRTVTTPATAGGSARQGIASPKLSLLATLIPELDVYANGGFGFHSNDARAAVHADSGLARAIGAEVGARVRPKPGLSASAALWYLYLSSEQVWNGDVGGTVAAGATERYGLDLDVDWAVTPWLAVDANIAVAHAAFKENAGNGDSLALAPKVMGGGGIVFHDRHGWISLRARGLGARPANDENTLTAQGYFVVDLVAGRRFGPWELGLTVLNVLNADWREAQFAEASRLPAEAMAVEGVHFTPGAPATALFTVGYVMK
jgi:TonB dependent receptor/TonB-dependent Receptor Plug Domain